MDVRGRRRHTRSRRVEVRDVALNVDVLGSGPPLVLMHGGPSADMWSLAAFRSLSDSFTTVFYDHRCNGRSGGSLETFTMDDLTADADGLRDRLGFDQWAVLGHSFGGHVALEYALRYPQRVSRLILLDTGAHSRWARENAPALLASRGYAAETVERVRRWFHGEFRPREFGLILLRISSIYYARPAGPVIARSLLRGGWRARTRPGTLIASGRALMDGWSVVERLGAVDAPTLVLAGREDVLFPPECQAELADGLPDARLVLVDGAGHNPHDEDTRLVLGEVRRHLSPLAAPGENR